jgi:RimJ/RimL family protein N-acetyltransferase
MTTTRHARLITGSAGAVVHVVDDPALGRVEFTVLDPEGDLDVLHEWVTRPSARFWGLGHLSREELRDTYAYVDSLPSHHAFLIRRDGLPIVLLQTYEPENDPLGDAYDARPGDAGIHFFLGDRGAPVAGLTTRIGQLIAGFMFAIPAVDRIVIEPDVENDRALARVRRFGFELGPRVRLPNKTGQLAVLTRDRWEGLGAPRPR